jgi:hypothetical protein
MSHFILTALDLLKVEAAELVREPSIRGVRQLMCIGPVREILQYIHPLTSIQLNIRRLDEPREVQYYRNRTSDTQFNQNFGVVQPSNIITLMYMWI